MGRSTWTALLLAGALSPVMHKAHAADAAAPSQPQFGGQWTEALAEGRHVATNCTSTWTDKDGKTYCFSNDGAKKSSSRTPPRICRGRRASWPPTAPSPPKRPCKHLPAPTRKPPSKQ